MRGGRADGSGFAFARRVPIGPEMDVSDLRVAIFSGNYNYVRDGANQALNRLADYLLRQGAAVRVYSPTTETPAFEPKGDLVSLPALPIPGRSEYRIGTILPPRVKRDLAAFRPNIFHVSSPDIHRPSRGDAGAQMGPAGDRLGPHPLRDLSALLRHGLPGAARARRPAPLLPPLRRDLRAVRFDGAAAARPAHELRRRHLDARHRPRDLQSRPARPGLAARSSASRTTCRWSASSAGW